MKLMKKGAAAFAALALSLALAMPIGVSAAQAVRGNVLYTDITAYVNGQQLPYYLLDTEYAYVALTDLTNYGFEILTNPQGKTASLSFNSSKLPTAIPSVEQVGKTGDRAYSYWSTDWKVYINGKATKYNVYNTAGRLSVDMRELDVYGKRVYDNGTRTVKLTTTASSPSQPSAPVATNCYVTGYVYDSAGRPVNNATVRLYGSGVTTKTVTTGTNGAYSITGIPSGSVVYLEATATGFSPVTLPSFTVNANVSGKHLRFGTSAGVSVSGYVRAPSGAVVPGATVKLVNASNAVIATVVSDTSGAYVFSGVAAGNYTIQVAATGYSAYTVPSFAVLATAITRDITLGSGAATITGTVLIPNGAYVQPSSVFVRIIDESGVSYSDSAYVTFPGNYDTNNASSQFSLTINKSFSGTKSFRVAVQYQYRLANESTYNRTGTAASVAVSVSSANLGQFTVGQISLNSATFTVSGYLSGLGSNEKARVYIEPASGSSSTYRNNYLTEWGFGGFQSNTYSFANVPNGTYNIYATLEGSSTRIAYVNNVTVNGGNVTNANMTINANTGFTVTVYASFGLLQQDVVVTGMQLVSTSQYGSYSSASNSYDANGAAAATFANVPAGTYEVRLIGYNNINTPLVYLTAQSVTVSSSGNIYVNMYTSANPF